MKQVYIINAGGFGRTAASTAQGDPDHGRVWVVRGMLDSRTDLPVYKDGLPLLGDPFSHQYAPDQIIVCALGDPKQRRHYAAPLLAQGADFMNLMPDLHRSFGVSMEIGCFFERNVTIGADSQLGSFVMVLANSIIGHDVKLGSYTTVGSFVFVGGGASIGADVVIHPHATILPGVTIGDGAIIGAGSVVLRDVAPGVTVFGNPAKPFQFR